MGFTYMLYVYMKNKICVDQIHDDEGSCLDINLLIVQLDCSEFARRFMAIITESKKRRQTHSAISYISSIVQTSSLPGS